MDWITMDLNTTDRYTMQSDPLDSNPADCGRLEWDLMGSDPNELDTMDWTPWFRSLRIRTLGIQNRRIRTIWSRTSLGRTLWLWTLWMPTLWIRTPRLRTRWLCTICIRTLWMVGHRPRSPTGQVTGRHDGLGSFGHAGACWTGGHVIWGGCNVFRSQQPDNGSVI